MILCDAGVLLCLVDRTQPQHNAYTNAILRLSSPLVTTWSCLTEAMYLALHRGGWGMQKHLGQLLLDKLLAIHEIQESDYGRLLELMEQKLNNSPTGEQRLMSRSTLYEQDFLRWTQQQAECLRKGRWAELDVENLVEELEALGRSEQRELGSYLQVLLMHLLKCQHQPERRTKSWNNTLSNCRDKIQDCLEDTPSLHRFIEDSEWVEKHYRRARRDAAKETQKPAETFPTECLFTVEQMLAPDFLA